MIYVNDKWESVKNIYDVIRIVKENLGTEFAETVKQIYNNNPDMINEIDRLELEIYELNDEMEEYSDYDYLKKCIKEIEKDLDNLENYILEQKESEFKNGLETAYKMLRGENSL